MDDYSLASLNDSKNEWCARLINVFTPHFCTGIQSIYNESLTICEKNKEKNKYLMTFQNFLSRIPHWNNNIIDSECERIIEASDCTYLGDMITCIHIIQLKMISCMRVSHINKKIDVKIPELEEFVHAVYINIARKVYDNVYLFDEKVDPLTRQKNMHEVEMIVRESIINTVRDNIPVAELLRIFLDESEEHDVETHTVHEPEPSVTNEEETEPQVAEEDTVGVGSDIVKPDNFTNVVKEDHNAEVVKENDIADVVNQDIKEGGSSSIKFADVVEQQDVNGKVETQPLDGEPKEVTESSSGSGGGNDEVSLKIDSDLNNTELDIVEIV